ncbi:MAG: hypothetical protein ABI947_11820 [Chloroflexota bacterium]
MNYYVLPKCKDPNNQELCLTLRVSGPKPFIYSVVVATKDLEREFQTWTPIEWLDRGKDQGFILLNPETNMVIVAPDDDQAVKVNPLASLAAIDRVFWKFVGSEYGAIQLQANTKMNLNVKGSGPYPSGTLVLAYSWKKKQSNAMWTFHGQP